MPDIFYTAYKNNFPHKICAGGDDIPKAVKKI